MKKPLILLVLGLIILSAGAFYFFNKQKSNQPPEQVVLEQTLTISQEYSVLRYRTENVLNTKNYSEYDAWNNEMSDIIEQWKELENDALVLAGLATKIAEEQVGFKPIPYAYAYSKEEVNSIIDKAPLGKKITTLANHLGVDAKHAQLILNQTQAEVSREAYGEEGDVFEKCEQNAIRIKNGAKVTVFVGGVIMTGGTSAIAASGALAQTALVVSGADLVLEVADDEAKIALGDRNKVSEMVGSLRVVTEPAAAILTLANIPGNLTKAIDKVSAAYFGADQIRSAVQDEKILGISIKVNETGELKTEVAGLTEEELPKWMAENNVVKSGESAKEILNQFEKEMKEEVKEDIKEEKQDKVEDVSGTSYMMDVCFNPTCWDDLDADPAEDRDLGGIYTLGKVFGDGESFRHGFRPTDFKSNSQSAEMLANSYKITVYFAIAPFEGPKNKTIDYGTWESHSVVISANYGDEPIIEWDGSSLKQAK